MASRDLPFPARSRPLWRRIVARWRTALDWMLDEWGPLALRLDHGLAGAVVGFAIWLAWGLTALAFAAGGLAWAVLAWRGRR